MRISELQVGQQRTIAAFGDERIAGKLLSMGVKPGSKVRLVRKTTFANTYYLRIDNFRMALRGEEAAQIVLN